MSKGFAFCEYLDPNVTDQVIIDRVTREIIRLVASMCLSIRLSVGALLFEPFDL